MRASKKSLRNLLAYDIYHHHGLSQSPHHASIVASRAAVEEAKSVVFLHGILGSKRNWRTPANVFRKLHPEFQCITVDFRGHGDSHVTIESEWDENTVDNSALDLYQLTHSSPLGLMNAPTILCAHSFGGKVALRYLEKIHSLGQKLPEHTWILDSIPGPYRRVSKPSLLCIQMNVQYMSFYSPLLFGECMLMVM